MAGEYEKATRSAAKVGSRNTIVTRTIIADPAGPREPTASRLGRSRRRTWQGLVLPGTRGLSGGLGEPGAARGEQVAVGDVVEHAPGLPEPVGHLADDR